MALERAAAICVCIVITSATADGQQQSNTTAGRQQEPAIVVEPTYAAGALARVRRVRPRTEADGRKVVVETVEGQDVEGRRPPFEEVVTETTQEGGATKTRQDVFRMTRYGQRRLAETSESRQDTQSNGDTDAVHSTWVPDLNGRLRLTSRRVEETRSSAADVQRITTTLQLPSVNETLRDAERTEYTGRRINPEIVRHESTRLARDVNGRWKPIEIRGGEVREMGTAERVEEVTIQRPDLNGNITTEMTVIRSSRTQDQEQLVTETCVPHADVRGSNGRPPLSARSQRTTTTAADGVRQTVEEVEARSRVSPNEPMRVVRRIVTTVTPTGTDESVTQRQVFTVDVNGRLRLLRVE